MQVTNRRDASQDLEVYTEAGGYVMSKYLIIYEKSGTGYGAYVPDLPGCVATGRTLDQTKRRMTKAIEMDSRRCGKTATKFPCRRGSVSSRSLEGYATYELLSA